LPVPIRFRVRPGYQSPDLLVELMGDHRAPGFPDLSASLRDQLGASRVPHPEGLDDGNFDWIEGRRISFWTYPGGSYEIDDDIWGLFVSANENNAAVIADIERALLKTGFFEKQSVDFDQFR
jgi:hypothetical protein